MSNLQANVPLVNVPFVDKNGNVTESWFLFLIQLWRRSGGNAPVPSNLTIADVLALEETFSPVQSIIGQDALVGETTFGSVGPADALGEMALATPSADSSIVDMVFAPAQAAEMLDKTYSSGTDFTPGTTTTLTLPATFTNAQQLWVFFDGVFQGDDQYALSGTTLTFTSAITVGTSKVYVKGLR